MQLAERRVVPVYLSRDLVLSEFAGAAAELDGAVVVNPYDVDGCGG